MTNQIFLLYSLLLLTQILKVNSLFEKELKIHSTDITDSNFIFRNFKSTNSKFYFSNGKENIIFNDKLTSEGTFTYDFQNEPLNTTHPFFFGDDCIIKFSSGRIYLHNLTSGNITEYSFSAELEELTKTSSFYHFNEYTSLSKNRFILYILNIPCNDNKNYFMYGLINIETKQYVEQRNDEVENQKLYYHAYIEGFTDGTYDYIRPYFFFTIPNAVLRENVDFINIIFYENNYMFGNVFEKSNYIENTDRIYYPQGIRIDEKNSLICFNNHHIFVYGETSRVPECFRISEYEGSYSEYYTAVYYINYYEEPADKNYDFFLGKLDDEIAILVKNLPQNENNNRINMVLLFCNRYDLTQYSETYIGYSNISIEDPTFERFQAAIGDNHSVILVFAKKNNNTNTYSYRYEKIYFGFNLLEETRNYVPNEYINDFDRVFRFYIPKKKIYIGSPCDLNFRMLLCVNSPKSMSYFLQDCPTNTKRSKMEQHDYKCYKVFQWDTWKIVLIGIAAFIIFSGLGIFTGVCFYKKVWIKRFDVLREIIPQDEQGYELAETKYFGKSE